MDQLAGIRLEHMLTNVSTVQFGVAVLNLRKSPNNSVTGPEKRGNLELNIYWYCRSQQQIHSSFGFNT